MLIYHQQYSVFPQRTVRLGANGLRALFFFRYYELGTLENLSQQQNLTWNQAYLNLLSNGLESLENSLELKKSTLKGKTMVKLSIRVGFI